MVASSQKAANSKLRKMHKTGWLNWVTQILTMKSIPMVTGLQDKTPAGQNNKWLQQMQLTKGPCKDLNHAQYVRVARPSVTNVTTTNVTNAIKANARATSNHSGPIQK